MLSFLFSEKSNKLNEIKNIDDFNMYKNKYLNIINIKNQFILYLEKLKDDINEYNTIFKIDNIDKINIVSIYKKNNIYNTTIIYKNINIYYLINVIFESFNDSLKDLLNKMKIIKNDNYVLIDKYDYNFEFKDNSFIIYIYNLIEKSNYIVFDCSNKEIFVKE